MAKKKLVHVALVIALLVTAGVSGAAQVDRFFQPRSRGRESATNRLDQVKNEANSAYQRGDYERTITLTNVVLQQNSADHIAYYLRASARCELGFRHQDKQLIRDGVNDAREALRFGRGQNNLYYIPYIYGVTKLALVENRKSHAEVALQTADQALGRPSLTQEERAHLTFQRAGAKAYLGQVDEAIADFDAAIGLDKQLQSAYIGRAETYVAAGQFDKALESYNQLVAAFPQSALAFDFRGVFHQEQGRLDEAIADFTRAVQIDPNYHSAYTNRGFTLLQTGLALQAEGDFSASLRISPQQPMIYSLRGSARLAQGRAEEAVDDQRQTVRLVPDAAPAHADLGFALYFAGRYADALASFEKAQSIDAGMRHLDAWRFVVQTLSGRAEEAGKIAAPSVSKTPQDRDWVDHVLVYLAGSSSDENLLGAVSTSDPAGANAQLCEAHFYIGISKKIAGDLAAAESHFQQALDTQAERLSTYRGAQFALKKFNAAQKTF